MSKEITVKDNSVDTFISQAIAANAPVEMMEKMFALHKEVKKEKGKEAFIEAMSGFQKDCPVIKKTKKVMNKDGTTLRYTFAPIDSIVDQIKEALAKNGLAYRWETKQEPGVVRAICIVTHIMGHSESSEFEVPIDTEGYMTQPQKFASALTFAKRYSLCNALGISTGDEDTDATDVKKEANAKSAKAKVIFLLRALEKPHKTKAEIEAGVKDLTKLDLSDENLEEIVARLEVKVQESHEDNNVQ